jgi:hypothetical protein
MVNEPFPRFVKYGFKSLHASQHAGAQRQRRQ